MAYLEDKPSFAISICSCEIADNINDDAARINTVTQLSKISNTAVLVGQTRTLTSCVFSKPVFQLLQLPLTRSYSSCSTYIWIKILSITLLTSQLLARLVAVSLQAKVLRRCENPMIDSMGENSKKTDQLPLISWSEFLCCLFRLLFVASSNTCFGILWKKMDRGYLWWLCLLANVDIAKANSPYSPSLNKVWLAVDYSTWLTKNDTLLPIVAITNSAGTQRSWLGLLAAAN